MVRITPVSRGLVDEIRIARLTLPEWTVIGGAATVAFYAIPSIWGAVAAVVTMTVLCSLVAWIEESFIDSWIRRLFHGTDIR